MLRERWTGACLLLAFLAPLACASHSLEEDRRRQAQEIWRGHEAVVARAIEGEQDLDQFMESVDFLSNLTGIEIHVEIFTMGYLPTPETPEDLELIRAWFKANGDRLYYDSDTRTVRVLER